MSVLRELGRHVAAVPYQTSIVGAADTLAEFGDTTQRELARRAGAGETILGVALAEAENWDPAQPTTTAVADGPSWLLTGTKITVPFAALTSHLLVTAGTAAGPALFLVETGAPGVTVTREEEKQFT